jgi:hypothetical protein
MKIDRFEEQAWARKKPRSWIALLLPISIFFTAWNTAHSQPVSDGEYSVKAAFLYNFAKFVEWPSTAFNDPDDPLVIGVLGQDPFRSALDELEGKSAGRRTIVVRRSKSVKELGKCHIVFVSKSVTGSVQEICQTLSKKAVLTVSDMDQFAQMGGMIGLSTVENRIRFSINLKVAQEAGLKLSSQLLKLATIVESSP